MAPYDFNTTTANSTSMLPGQTGPMATGIPSFVLPPVPAAATTPTVNVNLGAPSATATGPTAPATPQVPTPTVEQTQANANFRSSLNSAVNSGNPTPGSVLSSSATPTTAISSADKYYQDYLKQQKDFQDQVLTNMKPSAEEAAIRTKLAEQKTQAALNQETALNSGETSSFAGGEAQRVARTDAIKTAGLEAQVQTLQDSRKNAVDALQVLLNSGDKSFDALTKIETLKNTINSTDKNAIDTMNNLGQTYPDAKFTYDPQLSATENLALMKEAVVSSPSWASKSGAQPGSAPFQATIDIAAGNESGIGASKRAAAQLANLASTGDYSSLLVALKQQALKGMPAADKTEVIKADKQILSADRMANALQSYVAAGGDMNFLKGKSDDIATYFGKLAVDPKYKSLGVELKSAFQQYRVDMTGAAFGAAESADYASVVPTKDKELDLNLATLNGLKNYMTGKVDDAYTIALGEGYQNVKSLAGQKQADTQAAQVINPETGKNYTPEEIQAYKAMRGISFNQVGNTTASVTIPKTSNLAFVNSNPGNLRFAGQTGAVQGQGGFAKFDSPEAGLKALQSQITLDASRGHTLASFISKFAPPTENNTTQYISQAMANLGVSKDTPISKIPVDKLAKFIALKESSTKIKYHNMEHPLDKIYNVSASTNSGHPLDAVYGVANSQTPKQDWSKSLSDVGVPNIPVHTPGLLERGVTAIGKTIADSSTAIGGGIQNAIRAGGRVIGLNTPAVTSNQSLFGGNVDPVGYRNGQELGPVDTALQGAGNVAMGLANIYTGGEAAPIIAGGKALILPTLKTAAKVGAIQGGAMGGGEALSEGASPIETLLKTGVGSLLGAGTGLALGAGAKFTKNVVDKGFKTAASDLIPDIRNPFKAKTVAEIMATPEAKLGGLSDAKRNIYTSNKRAEITQKAQAEIDAIAKRHNDELNTLNTTAQQEASAIRTTADETAVKLANEEKALKESMATQSIKEAEALKPRLASLIKEKGNEYVKLIDEQMTPDIAQSQVTQNEIASSIRKGVQPNNPISQQQAEEDIAKLSEVLKKGSTVKDIYETAKQLRADSFGKSAGTSRVLNKDEIQATRLINRLMTFLKDERGVDFTKANQFWSEWAPNRNLLVKKIQPYTAAGRENASFNTFARQLTSTNPKDANFIKNLEDTFGIKVSDLDSRKILAKLDDNAKAKIANDVTKKAKTDELRLKKAQDKEQARLKLEVEKGKITQAKADELASLKLAKDTAQLKAEQRKFILNIVKAVTGVSLIGGVIPVIGKIGQGEK